ncbi:TIGR04222 domain-containing membrane protein [Sphingomonas sp.]|uniref:TIGR04222 domain-containing membrane protein n=1 Tax=Sphingomonas sp. TaxID=28214 RepID=UPI0018023FFF|nr:TIGR04222 domain-containing membrane protein [Sphingomonas sp.]MBA4762030.1 TIGR04222 domain-containing membrane protein [Sphingomonas sp.]
MGPFDWTGGPFLLLYIILLAIVVLLGVIIPARMRPEGRRRPVTDPEQLAYLAGGSTRLADTVTARLLAAKALVVGEKGRLDIISRNAATATETGVLALSAPLDWARIERAVRPEATRIQSDLERAGLMLDRGERANLCYWALLPYAMLLMFGATKLAIGVDRDRPVGFLIALLVVTAILALIRAGTIARLTRAGTEALATARKNADRIRRAPRSAEAGLAVALFGTAVLAGSELDAFHKLRAASGDSGSGGDSGSDSGGSGCGGGGCGGCGS